MAEVRSTNQAFGGPGISPKWTSGSKSAVGTAHSSSSQLWFTMAGGIVTEIYYPTIDRPQTRDLEFLITDGKSFFHEEKRHLTPSLEPLSPASLGCRVTSEAPGGSYRLVKEVVVDPAHSCLLVRGRIDAEPALLEGLSVFVLLAPHLEVGGWHNSAQVADVNGRALLTAEKGTAWLACGADRPFLRQSCGYVGASDGWTDLSRHLSMDWTFDTAPDGNVALTGQLDLAPDGTFTLGVALGESLHRASTTLLQALALPFPERKERFIEQWEEAGRRLDVPREATGDGGFLFQRSHSLLLAHEDKNYPGATIASLSIPWGEVKGDDELGGYHLVWTRDMVQGATALLACGHRENALRSFIYLMVSQWADGGFPQNFWVSGEPYWHGIQLDEVAFPILLAWQLDRRGLLGELDAYPMVKAAAAYLIRQGPATHQERWEENSGYSPSTLAVSIAALVAAAGFARERGDLRAADFLEGYADFLASHVERWTVTTQGTLDPEIPRHYIRLKPIDMADPSPDEDPNTGTLVVKNLPPGEPCVFPAREIVDGGFLELVRHGIRAADDPVIVASVKLLDRQLKVDTPRGPLWHRYNHDGYGQGPDGSPFAGTGRGRGWPLLTGERGHYELAAGRDPSPYIEAMEAFATSMGLIPEQVWDEADLPTKGFYLGQPTGSANPLLWAHAEYVKLVRSRADGAIFDQIPLVRQRYAQNPTPSRMEVWKFSRQVRQVQGADKLRVIAERPFTLHASLDGWASAKDLASEGSGLGLHFADVDIPQGQTGSLHFTFYWPEADRWEGRDSEVAYRP